MARRASIAAALVACVLLSAEGAPPPVLRFPFWACSDGKGTISLFWLPVGGEWPAGGYRLERVSRGKVTVLGGPLRPGQDARAMMELDPGDADAIRSLADKIERGTLGEGERSRSVSVMGRAAAADAVLGRALGVRYTDVPRVRGKIVYRLTALRADGGPGNTMESAAVDPARPTPAPERPAGLRAEERDDGVALFWKDPPAGPVAPVVAYRVDRVDAGKRGALLTPKPLLLDRHLRRGDPEFVDGAAPAKRLTYRVRSVDLFGRLSAPVQTGITVKRRARAERLPGAAVSRAASPAPATPPLSRAAFAPTTGPATVVPAAPAAAAPVPAPERHPASAPVPETPEPAGWAAAKEEPAARAAGPLPPPVIVGIAGRGDRVVVRFKPGDPEDLTHEFLVVRSESPTGAGVNVGRPLPGSTREWEDTTVSAGQYFWYRLVAVDGAGNRSEPSKPKWVSTGSR